MTPRCLFKHLWPWYLVTIASRGVMGRDGLGEPVAEPGPGCSPPEQGWTDVLRGRTSAVLLSTDVSDVSLIDAALAGASCPSAPAGPGALGAAVPSCLCQPVWSEADDIRDGSLAFLLHFPAGSASSLSSWNIH